MNITIQQNMTGAVNLSEGNSTFNFQVFGLKNKDASILNITASFDPNDSNYISNVLNKDPEKFQELGHLLYAHYDIHPSLATITGTSITTIYDRYKAQEVAFLLTGSRDRDTGANDAPNYESFEDIFTNIIACLILKYALLMFHCKFILVTHTKFSIQFFI